MKKHLVWLITGANRGLGRAVADAALQAGDCVAAAARQPPVRAEPEERREFVRLDVTDPGSIAAAVDETLRRFGRIDVLVNNAGYGQLGPFEEISEPDVRQQFETNVFGLMNVTRAVLPVMREQRSGQVFNIASAAGYKGGDRHSVYSASKFAVVGFSESLAAEVREFGVHVTSIGPGFFRTDFLDPSSVRHSTHPLPAYEAGSEAKRALTREYSHRQPGDPFRLGVALVALARAEEAPLHFLAGADAIDWVAQRDARVHADIERFKALSVSTSFSG
jgi:NAD(P)-dependent dehydrogenase (short-subunit alcohol dehydrogenase family)